MKQILLFLLMITAMVNAQLVDIPDPQFKANLLEASPTEQIAKNFNDDWIAIDANSDGQIQVSEAQAVKYLIIKNYAVTGITGIGSFSNLETLHIRTNQMASAEFPAMPNLKTLILLDLQYMTTLDIGSLSGLTTFQCISMYSLTSIDFTALTNLEHISCSFSSLTSVNVNGLQNLLTLNLFGNLLSNLDASGAPNLTTLNCSMNRIVNLNVNDLVHLTELNCATNRILNLNGVPNSVTKLNCNGNRLTDFSINGLVNLVELDCANNEITSLNVNSLSQLTKLSCGSNKFSSLVVNGLTNLSEIECSGNPELTNLTLSNLPALENLKVLFSTGLTSMNLSGLPNLEKLHCSSGALTSLNLANLASLTELDCSYNQISSLNLTNLPNLVKLNCSVNPMTSLDASGLSNLEDLTCGSGYVVNGLVEGHLTNLNVAGLSNLKNLNCSWSLLDELDLTGLTSLETLSCDGIANDLGTLTSLEVNHLTNLKSLSCSFQQLTSLNVSNLTHLEILYCAYNHIANLDLTGLVSLKTLDYNYNQLANLNLVNLPSLETLTCSNNQLVTLNVLDLTNLKSLNCSSNQLTTLNLSGLTSLESLDYSFNELTLSNVSGLSTNLKSLSCKGNNLTSLDVSGLTNLETLGCGFNQLTSLDLSTLANLKSLDCSQNQLAALEVSHMNDLELLNCSSNLLTDLDIAGLNNIRILFCGNNQLTTLDLTGHTALTHLDYSLNALPDLDVAPLTNLILLTCMGTQTTTLDVSNMPDLQYFNCSDNQLTTLDLNNAGALQEVTCRMNLLTSLFMKNGNTTPVDFSGNPTLQYICADADELEAVQTTLNDLGMNATVSNTYCSFAPGGDFNTIEGIAIFDVDNDGCEVTDEVNPFVRFDINDGTTTGATVTNINGEYSFFANAGNYTVAPNVENPTWFQFTPASAAFEFANNNNNTAIQNFCIAAVGAHPDLEVVVAPLEPARPGFDARYKIVYKNKGNQMLSGMVSLAFDDTKSDLVNALPAPDNTAINNLSWNYVNLMPFENRSITLTLNINTPVETPPVNNGDILTFAASITPASGDEIPSDNQFTLTQTVIGSYDPNAKTCLEGDVVSSSQIGNYLHYNIQFENLGTAEAVNVVIRDVIDTTKFDISTLQVLYASHAMRANIQGNVVEFIFADIDLAPAAGDPPVGGHGNVLFKIKTLPTLTEGTIVENTASIFFDYNAPIDTDPARTTFQLLGTPDVDQDDTISVYPNPTQSILNIKSAFHISKVEVFDIQGRILQTNILDENAASVDLSSRATGIYFIRIHTGSGEKIVKAVKQ
ncbi:leucine-rich repeat domain-containing protein [Flavobacterium selenitireducens]|uniref:leucine-rich repeat domain-containing protein n=1 Tax=Flavobacterium selenitireducens TaxID=2722704 RepID=UPI00168A5439|nr:leucine-rich repeat domain-containing protein [Flavobacterium selenitireducens]MBD3582808.1 T9SS type A sorting domain-containing protein [Flavobacterium selenitireducens]